MYGGVGMGPQEHAFRSGVDVIVGTPGRLLDHFRQPYAKLGGLEYLVLDEADRMLDMGFLPDIRRVLRHIPSKRQTLFFSATMPDADREAVAGDAAQPGDDQPRAEGRCPRRASRTPSIRCRRISSRACCSSLLNKGDVKEALVFTRTKHRADRLAKHLEQHKVSVQRIHGNRSQSQRTEALAGFKSGKYRVLVATDIAARGIDVTALGHVINFDVPAQPEDYIHRVGRTARAELTGSAFTLVAPEDEGSVREIERAINKRLPRVTVPDFDYTARAEQRLEMPHAQRIAEIRARKADERQRAKANAERRARHGHAQPAGQAGPRQGQRDLARPGRGRTGAARQTLSAAKARLGSLNW